MYEIWAKLLLPNALNGCPKCKKSPNLVTLILASNNVCKLATYFNRPSAANFCLYFYSFQTPILKNTKDKFEKIAI